MAEIIWQKHYTVVHCSSAQNYYDDALESYSVVPDDEVVPGEEETFEPTGSSNPSANSTVFHVNTKPSATTGAENAIHDEGLVTTDSPGTTFLTTPGHAGDDSDDVEPSTNTPMFAASNIDLGEVANASRLRPTSSKPNSESPNEGRGPSMEVSTNAMPDSEPKFDGEIAEGPADRGGEPRVESGTPETTTQPLAATEKLSRSAGDIAAAAASSTAIATASEDLMPPKRHSSEHLRERETGGVDKSTNSAPEDSMREAGNERYDAVTGRNGDRIVKSIDGRLVSTDFTTASDSEVSKKEEEEEGERKARLVLPTSQSDLGDEIKIERSGGGGGDDDVLLGAIHI